MTIIARFDETGFFDYIGTLSVETKATYIKHVSKYKVHCLESDLNFLDSESVLSYAHELHKTYAASSIWTMLSPICTYFSNSVSKIIIASTEPILKRSIKNWEKDDEVKKAKTFTEAEINTFVDEAPDSEYLVSF
jgi:hypothetical protein